MVLIPRVAYGAELTRSVAANRAVGNSEGWGTSCSFKLVGEGMAIYIYMYAAFEPSLKGNTRDNPKVDCMR